MTKCLFDYLKEQDVKYDSNFLLSKISSIKIGGSAFVVIPNSESQLIEIVRILRKEKLRYKIVGRMTNILPSDDNYNGVIILTRKLNKYFISENFVEASSGIMFSSLLRRSMESGLSGAEALYGIPGSLGGMIRSNAGAFGSEISDFILSVKAYDPVLNKTHSLCKNELCFAYRESIFSKTDLVILSARLRFLKKDKDLILSAFDKYTKIRKASQPYSEPSLGSVFKKHSLAPVSLLIDRAGLKGACVGGAEISNIHAGFIVNKGGATSSDVKKLIFLIKEKLLLEYGIVPEEEIEFL